MGERQPAANIATKSDTTTVSSPPDTSSPNVKPDPDLDEDVPF